MKIYKVGGCVRDKYLGIDNHDTDYVVTGSSPVEMMALGFYPVGKDFPVYLHPVTKEEYALARKERKTGKGYRGFKVDFNPYITIFEDLERRDFSINAMAENEEEFIDLFNGEKDLRNKKIRAVNDKSFIEDPLRVLRAARFVAKLDGFTIEPKTLQLMIDMVNSGELRYLTPERVWIETEKALATDHPERYFQVLEDCGALAVVFPELQKLVNVPQPEKHHRCDVWNHALLSLKASTGSKDLTIRFAALVHDLGKGETPIEFIPHHYGHEVRGPKIIRNLCKRLRIPNSYRDFAVLVASEHMNFHKLKEMTPQKLLRLCKKLVVFHDLEKTVRFISTCICDSKMEVKDPEYLQDEGLKRGQANLLLEIAVALKNLDNQEVLELAREKREQRNKKLKALGREDEITDKPIDSQDVIHRARLTTIKKISNNFRKKGSDNNG